jgi:hypothetical protein
VNNCNHFDFAANFLDLYPEPATKALLKLSNGVEKNSAKLIQQYPFDRAFSAVRKRAILKMLAMRADVLKKVLARQGNAA